MKTIMFVHSSSDLYGSDKSLLNLIKSLDKKKFKIIVCLPSQGPLVMELEEYCKVYTYNFAVLRRKNFNLKGMCEYFINTIRSINYFIKLIKKHKVDIVYTNTAVVISGAIASKLSKKTSVWHIREIINNFYENFIISWLIRVFSDKVISNSKSTESNLFFQPKNKKVIYNTIDLEKNDNNYIRTYEKRCVVGMAGRINRWKGQRLFLEAANDVICKYPETDFVIAGDVYPGDEYIKKNLIEFINEKKIDRNIELLGEVKDMNDFYNKIDLFVLPSILPEPFGNVILEAMYRGIPVIATNHGGPSEIIEHGTNGFLVDFSTSFEMSNMIEKLMNDPQTRLEVGSRGKQTVINKFSNKDYITSIEDYILS